ncbi:hypothetical protein NEOLEDRAFT_167050 [Neolentinus lepideus HHB14362 ss-1]|uniref:Uncharacterized protein n=1 Tax=Neolentinus lepideus HHB14362 ss-1 TaxID=1314782 RepID=A0A165TVV5_9AGAM|nr:hypothetical protein NEOLEDRAFT_167050 [Neolentinus lepideus HHB14362 ss-1]
MGQLLSLPVVIGGAWVLLSAWADRGAMLEADSTPGSTVAPVPEPSPTSLVETPGETEPDSVLVDHPGDLAILMGGHQLLRAR